MTITESFLCFQKYCDLMDFDFLSEKQKFIWRYGKRFVDILKAPDFQIFIKELVEDLEERKTIQAIFF